MVGAADFKSEGPDSNHIRGGIHGTSLASLGGSVGCAGDQEVAGSTPAEVGSILSWRLIVKYFLRSFSPFR